jgi:hypothetical protein
MPVIKFYPTDEEVGGFAPPPVPVRTMMPEWFRKLPPYLTQKPEVVKAIDDSPNGGHFLNVTGKKCMSMIDTFTTGYYFLCPVDIFIDTTNPKDIQLKWRNPRYEFILTHNPEQVGDYPVDDNLCEDILRWVPFWCAVTPEGYSTLIITPAHRPDLPFITMTGIIDTDSMPSAGALPFHIKKNYKGIIKRGTPIAQAIPFKREEWSSEIIEERSQEVRDRLNLINSSFSGMYQENMWEKKTFK